LGSVVSHPTDISPEGVATAMPDSDWRISQYRLPEILSYLAKVGVGGGNGVDNCHGINSGSDINGYNSEVSEVSVDFGGVFGLLNEGLRRAREFDDKLFISIFETAIRAACKVGVGCGLSRETIVQLERLSGFRESYELSGLINERWGRAFDMRLFRHSRMCGNPLLMFLRAVNDSDIGGLGYRRVGYDFFVIFNGSGLAINPSCDFFDGLYQVGGVLGDVGAVLITGWDKFDRGFVERLKFYRSRQVSINGVDLGVFSGIQPINFFVAGEFSGELSRALMREFSGVLGVSVIDIGSVRVSGEELMILGGVGVSFRGDQLSLRVTSACSDWEFGERWIRFIGQSGILREYLSGDVVVFMVEGEAGFFSAVGLSKIAGAGLTVFDISQQVFGLSRLIGVVRGYIDAAAIVGQNLVCELSERRFLDVVKSFDSDEYVWSSYDEIDNCDENLYYFSKNLKERFNTEKTDISETFLINRRRRHGLYFKKF
jgi:hypothetical protein